MRSRLFAFLLTFIAACTDGPETPYTLDGPAVALTFNFRDLPSEEIHSAVLMVTPVMFPPDIAPPWIDFCDGPSSVLEPFVAEGARFRIPSFGSAARDEFACTVRDPLALHFFKVRALLNPTAGARPSKDWTPGAYDLVYAPQPTVFRPFGPFGPETTFPAGFSWLQRGCGPAGASELSVISTDEVLDLHPDGGGSQRVETTERNLAAACGVTPPKVSIGTRVTFGRARALAWAADDASLYYLPFDDEQDETGGIGIRQVRLADQTVSEIAVVPRAENLQTGPSGVLYVGSTPAATYALSPSSGASTPLQELQLGTFSSLSPDGLWFAIMNDPSHVHLWSVPSAAEIAVLDGSFLGWSPDSRLLYGPDSIPISPQSAEGQVPYDLFLVAPALPDQPVKCGAISMQARYSGVFAWGASECPVLVNPSLSWSIESTVSLPDCENCFGLSAQDPMTGVEQTILPSSSGLVRPIHVRPVAGFAFAWERTCMGLYNTVCSYSLLRVRLATGTAESVATADQILPVALSSDNRRLALAASNGIYVKELPQ